MNIIALGQSYNNKTRVLEFNNSRVIYNKLIIIIIFSLGVFHDNNIYIYIYIYIYILLLSDLGFQTRVIIYIS